MELLQIGQVAAATGLSVRTLRYYEDAGLVTPSARMAGGRRLYSAADVERLYRVCVLRRLGRPVAAIPALLDGGEDLRPTVEAHLAELDAELLRLSRRRERVSTLRDSLTRQGAASPGDRDLLTLLEDFPDSEIAALQRITLLVYDDIEAAQEWLVRVFGFGDGPLARDDTGRAVHAELYLGDGTLWLHPTSREHGLASPRTLGASTHCMAVMVQDVDAHHARALAAGARVQYPPRDVDYGYREYDVHDLEGGLWSFMRPLGDVADLDQPENPS